MNVSRVMLSRLGPNWVHGGKGCYVVLGRQSSNLLILFLWMGGRAVEGTGLENRQGRKLLVGSNPTPSAN